MSSELDIGITHAENNTAVRSAGLSSSSNVSADGIVRRDQPESDCFIDINNTISREFNKKAEDVEHSSTHESVEHERWTQAASIQQLWKVTPEEANEAAGTLEETFLNASSFPIILRRMARDAQQESGVDEVQQLNHR